MQIWQKKGADLTTFGQEKKGADLTKKGADLTIFWQEKKGADLTKKVQIWLIAVLEDLLPRHYSSEYKYHATILVNYCTDSSMKEFCVIMGVGLQWKWL